MPKTIVSYCWSHSPCRCPLGGHRTRSCHWSWSQLLQQTPPLLSRRTIETSNKLVLLGILSKKAALVLLSVLTSTVIILGSLPCVLETSRYDGLFGCFNHSVQPRRNFQFEVTIGVGQRCCLHLSIRCHTLQ